MTASNTVVNAVGQAGLAPMVTTAIGATKGG